jgi:hypothetical protein
MKPTTEPQSHLVSQNAQPRYASMSSAPPSGSHLSRTSPVKSVASAPFRRHPLLARLPKPLTDVARITSERSKTHRANFR